MRLPDLFDNFQYEGWAVHRAADGALLLERDGKMYRVEVHRANLF